MLTALGAVDLSSNLSDPIMTASSTMIGQIVKKLNSNNRRKDIQRVVLFDMMGVIFKEGRFSRLIHELVPKSKLSTIRRRYNLFRVGAINDVQFWDGLVDDPINTEERFLNKFKLDKEFLPLIRKLRRRKYRLAILSNIPRKWKNCLLKKYKIEKYFDTLIFSCDIGVAKPDRTAYLTAIAILKTDPKEIMFIDDELDNLIPAKRIGMKTIYMNRREEDDSFHPDYSIKKLSKLAEIVK